jgi:N-acetyl-gamma-glutamylphosphate reductase
LRGHPLVGEVTTGEHLLSWSQGDWHRSIRLGVDGDAFGLVEMIDNNPMVCATTFGWPGPLAILHAIAIGPLVRAGLIVEPPSSMSNITPEAGHKEFVGDTLGTLGEFESMTIFTEMNEDVDRSYAGISALAEIRTPERLEDLDDLYEEAFGRSFFVREVHSDELDASEVKGIPGAIYRLRITPDDPISLLRIDVLADHEGKVGAAGIVHAFNVMIGCEESFGIPANLSAVL